MFKIGDVVRISAKNGGIYYTDYGGMEGPVVSVSLESGAAGLEGGWGDIQMVSASFMRGRRCYGWRLELVDTDPLRMAVRQYTMSELG